MFIDRAKLQIHAGKGGNGVVAWRREKFIPKGGPCGGDGGKGGAIIIEATTQVSSLDWFRNRRILKAENGGQGGHNHRKGRDGKDLTLKVPCGTLVKDVVTGEILADLTDDKQKFIVCRGGKGGYGNDRFKSPTNRAPNNCTPGQEGESRDVEFELKLIADIGLVGFPNAGKSTLIGQVAGVRVKVAPYPFTTLQPNLGLIKFDDFTRVLIADIPGIIEGAHRNKGLGFEFLRHIERTELLLYVLDASGIDGRTPSDDYKVLRDEMEKYNPELLKRPSLVILNKTDVEESAEHIKAFRKKFKVPKGHLFALSAASGEGIPELLEAIEKLVQGRKKQSK